MRIGQVNNTSFKSKYYEGSSYFKNRKEEFHFETMNMRPQLYLTGKQNAVTQIIEEEIDKTAVDEVFADGTKSGFRMFLDCALDGKHTDIYFRYPNQNTVEAELVKWGFGSWGDEYCYNPYNKNGDKRIKVRFSLDKMPSAEIIKEKTAQFLADCKAFLTDNDNPKNKEIEHKLWEKC